MLNKGFSWPSLKIRETRIINNMQLTLTLLRITIKISSQPKVNSLKEVQKDRLQQVVLQASWLRAPQATTSKQHQRRLDQALTLKLLIPSMEVTVLITTLGPVNISVISQCQVQPQQVWLLLLQTLPPLWWLCTPQSKLKSRTFWWTSTKTPIQEPIITTMTIEFTPRKFLRDLPLPRTSKPPLLEPSQTAQNNISWWALTAAWKYLPPPLHSLLNTRHTLLWIRRAWISIKTWIGKTSQRYKNFIASKWCWRNLALQVGKGIKLSLLRIQLIILRLERALGDNNSNFKCPIATNK